MRRLRIAIAFEGFEHSTCWALVGPCFISTIYVDEWVVILVTTNDAMLVTAITYYEETIPSAWYFFVYIIKNVELQLDIS